MIKAILDNIKGQVKEFYNGDDEARKVAEARYCDLIAMRDKAKKELEEIENTLIEARTFDRSFGVDRFRQQVRLMCKHAERCEYGS